MMFLIRTAFWLSLVVLLLPTDPQKQAKLYATASGAVAHVATFCDRNRSLCDRGSDYWAVFQTKLEFGGRMALDLASERLFGSAPRQPGAAVVSPTANTQMPAARKPTGV